MSVSKISHEPLDELEALARTQTEYIECSLMCFTETWLHDQIPDSNVTIPGFHSLSGQEQREW